MAKKRRFEPKRNKRPAGALRTSTPREALAPLERKAPTQYGEPFMLIEDHEKNTFEYARGAWVPYALSIAECQRDSCQVKALPQKVKGMTRYEVRCPV